MVTRYFELALPDHIPARATNVHVGGPLGTRNIERVTYRIENGQVAHYLGTVSEWGDMDFVPVDKEKRDSIFKFLKDTGFVEMT